MKIWKKSIIKEYFQNLFLLLLGFIILFIAIDTASNPGGWRQHGTMQVSYPWLVYYLSQIAIFLEVLVPFAAVFAALRTVLRMNSSKELLALRCAGLSLKRILSPLLIAGLLLSFFLLSINEYARPSAEVYLASIERERRKAKYEKEDAIIAQSVPTGEGGNLFYLSFDPGSSTFFETYWIKGSGEIFRIKELSLQDAIPVGHFVEELARDDHGVLKLVLSSRERVMQEFSVVPEEMRRVSLQPQLLSLSELWQKSKVSSANHSLGEAALITLLYKRITLPFLPLLAIAAPLPFCLTQKRERSYSLLYGCTLFCLVSFTLFADAMGVLGARQIISPFQAVGVPILISTLLLFGFYRRLQ